MIGRTNAVSECSKVIIDGVRHKGDLVLVSQMANLELPPAPSEFISIPCAVLNNEIHILGCDSLNTKHCKWNGSEWIDVSTLPCTGYESLAVVLNNEIHILGGYGRSGGSKTHYKWNGSAWTSASTLPKNCDSSNTVAVALNGEIHLITGGYHYKWNGSAWTLLSGSSYNSSIQYIAGSAAVAHEGKIHIFGYTDTSSSYSKNHTIWDGVKYTSTRDLPYYFGNGAAVVLDGKIHIIGCSAAAYQKNHYAWNGAAWEDCGKLCRTFYNGAAGVMDGVIHLIGGYYHSDSSVKCDLHTALVKKVYMEV